ncbi:MAG: transposase [Microcoleus sp.]
MAQNLPLLVQSPIGRSGSLGYLVKNVAINTKAKFFFHEDLNLKGLTKRNKVKQDEDGKYLPNGQSAKSGLNKSWLDAAFGQFFTTLSYIGEKTGAVVVSQKPAYTSMLLCYRNEMVFTDCNIREYWDEQNSLMVDRDLNAAIHLKRLGLDIFPSIKRPSGNLSIVGTMDNSTRRKSYIPFIGLLRSPHHNLYSDLMWEYVTKKPC